MYLRVAGGAPRGLALDRGTLTTLLAALAALGWRRLRTHTRRSMSPEWPTAHRPVHSLRTHRAPASSYGRAELAAPPRVNPDAACVVEQICRLEENSLSHPQTSMIEPGLRAAVCIRALQAKSSSTTRLCPRRPGPHGRPTGCRCGRSRVGASASTPTTTDPRGRLAQSSNGTAWPQQASARACGQITPRPSFVSDRSHIRRFGSRWRGF